MVSIIAAPFGFGGIAAASADIARILLLIAISSSSCCWWRG
jgi:uncharacterized membrane protein YtjA (UPF0391 family)